MNVRTLAKSRPAEFSLVVCLLMACFDLLAQDPVSYPVGLEVEGEVLKFSRASNCEISQQSGDVCIAGGYPAEIVFSLGRGSDHWEISRMFIRDPSGNWGDTLPQSVQADFPQFDRQGRLAVSTSNRGSLVIQNSNAHSLAVQYGIVVRDKETGVELNPAHAEMDNAGGAPTEEN